MYIDLVEIKLHYVYLVVKGFVFYILFYTQKLNEPLGHFSIIFKTLLYFPTYPSSLTYMNNFGGLFLG